MAIAPITSFDTLVAAVADWLDRSDLTSQIPVFVQLAEASMNKDERFRIPAMMVRAQATVSQQFMALPGDLIEMENFRLLVQTVPSSGVATLEYVTPNQLDELRVKYAPAGQPRFYTIAAQTAEFLPAPGASYTAEMIYHARLPALSTANEVNWLLANHPDIYLYGALLQAAPYLKDDSRIATWASLYSAGADALNVSTERAKYGAAPLKMRTRSFY
jgi:hypothetical protein